VLAHSFGVVQKKPSEAISASLQSTGSDQGSESLQIRCAFSKLKSLLETGRARRSTVGGRIGAKSEPG
jgi:hypothetical protein